MDSQDSGTVFVLMPFRKSLESVYMGLIKPPSRAPVFAFCESTTFQASGISYRALFIRIESARLNCG